MKVDFIHLGYHKTASTWFQLFGYGKHPDILLLNHPKTQGYRLFMDTFVYPDNFNFSHFEFSNSFNGLNLDYSNKFVGICEENLTGNFWNGRNSDVLLDRIAYHFSESKIILCIREQRAMFRSLYLNYVKHGGCLSINKLVNDPCFDGCLIFDKLKYGNYLRKLYTLYDPDNIFIYTYEEFLESPCLIYRKICDFLRIKNIKIENKIINHSRGRLTLKLERILNKLGLHNCFTQKAFDVCSKFDLRITNIPFQFSQHNITQWAKSNDEVRQITNLELNKLNYL